MSIVIRMSRLGRTNRPSFRVGVYDTHTRRDGPPIEHLGHYDPLVADEAKNVVLDADRIRYWLSQGARVTDTVRSFLEKRGIEVPNRRQRPNAAGAPASAPGKSPEAGRPA